MEKLNLLVTTGDVTRTLIAKSDINGNRHTLVINDTTREFIHSGSHLGNYGNVAEKLTQKVLKEEMKHLEKIGYTKCCGAINLKTIW